MIYQELAAQMRHEYLREEAAAAPADGATTMNAISYLPSQVGKVRGALKTLKQKKNKWNLEVHESDEGYKVQFEDALVIDVAKEHWDHFQGMFEGVLDNNAYLDLQVQLMDRVQLTEEQMIKTRQDEFLDKVLNTLFVQETHNVMGASSAWLKAFGCEKDLSKLTDCVGRFNEFIDEKIEECGDDLGALEIMIENFSVDSLKDAAEYLIADRYSSSFAGVGLVFEAQLNFDFEGSCSIWVQDSEAADVLEEAYIGLQRIGNVFYPRFSQVIKGDLLESIKEIISDLGEQTNDVE
jgi:hypothetical protein